MVPWIFGFPHLAYHTKDNTSRSIHVVTNGRISFFLMVNNIVFCTYIWRYTTFSLSIYLLMDIWVISISCLLWIMLQWTWEYKYLCNMSLHNIDVSWQPRRLDWNAHAWMMMTSLYVSGGGRHCWVSTCTVWLSHSKWLSRATNLHQILCEAWTFLHGNYLDDLEGHRYGQLVICSFILTACLFMYHISCRIFLLNIKSPRWLSPTTAWIWHPETSGFSQN